MQVPQFEITRLCGMNCHYIRYTFEYFLDAMVKLGYRNIELWAASPHCYVEDMTVARTDSVRREIERRRLRLACFTPEQVTYPINIAAREDLLRQRSVDYYTKAVELTEQLGAKLMLLTPGWGYNDEPREEAWKRSADSIARIAAKAEALGVTLALEHLTQASSNLINTAAHLKQMLDEVPSQNLKAMFDVVQVGVAGERSQRYFELLGKEIVHVHFVDGNPGGHLAPGDGTLPLEEEWKAIHEENYAGFLSLEIADRRYFGDPMEADRRSLALLKAWMRQSG